MKVNVINEYRIEMELCEDELSDFDITYESMDYSDVNTRRFLRELAQNAKMFGIDADMSGKVLIEAFRINGGCRVCFTFLPSRTKDAPSVKQLIKKDISCVFIEKNDIDLLCRFCRALGDNPESSLYRCEDRYFLFITLDPEKAELYYSSAAEYGIELLSDARIFLSKCREYNRCLIESQAVKGLAEV